MCRLVSFAISVEPFGSAKAVTKCEEHNWMMEGYFTQLPDQQLLCPLGRVEKAVEDGLAKIDAAVSRSL